MIFHLLTTFPNIFTSYISESILGRAQKRGMIKIKIHNLRDFTSDKHHTTDDTPYGGGAGMVMKIEPIYQALRKIIPSRFSEQGLKNQGKAPASLVLLLSARGEIFNQSIAQSYLKYKNIILICGHYEGVDQRVADYFCDSEISIGQFVVTGGELGAMVIVDAVSRLIPDVLGNNDSPKDESFTPSLDYLEYPQYTRPENFQGLSVPKVLLSGNHKEIEKWRKGDS